MEKYRNELKYLCNNIELELIEKKICCIMKPDDNVSRDGSYVVRSVYFDDYRDCCFFENESGTNPREKFRIRIYNQEDKTIKLEKKIKNRQKTLKQSCLLDYGLCEKLLKNEPCNDYFGENSLLDEFLIKRNNSLMRPKVLVEYVRTPYIYTLGNVRVTFDKNIAASGSVEELFSKDITRISVFPSGHHVLEVKYDDYLPEIIAGCLDTGHLNRSSVSKYYICRKALKGEI